MDCMIVWYAVALVRYSVVARVCHLSSHSQIINTIVSDQNCATARDKYRDFCRM